MLKFKSVTTIEFTDMESLEVFVKTLPLPPHMIVQLLEGEEIVDDQDKVEATGAGKTVHKFKIEGEE